MRNEVPYSPTRLFALSGQVLGGVKKYAVALGLHHNTEAVITADRAAMNLAMGEYATAKLDLKTLREELKASVDDAFYLVTKGRDVLKEEFGGEFSTPWIQLNYVGSLYVDRSAEELLPKLVGLKGFYTANPDKQVPDLRLTVGEMDVLLTKVGDGLDAVNEKKGLVKTLSQARKAAAKKMHKRIRSVIKELSDLMPPLDGRWEAFGLNQPGAVAVADVPENVTVVLIGNNAASVKWSGAARADYYRVWKRVLGTDAEFVAVGSPADVDFTIENLPATAQVEIAVSAVNTGGESLKSGVVAITTL